uniref:adaptin ear-binding coat-associated protein 1-like isoform X2 n=1 Tax=Pristiophorus japonicus TaxID=55135 RepID=UPI00398EF0E4
MNSHLHIYNGELFAQAPVETYPGIAVESVTDSSRYFVLRIQDGSGRGAFIGIGFSDREDAFDFNVALQQHFRWVKQDAELLKQEQNLDTGPKLDLGFKEGQTLELNIGNIKKRDRSRPRATGGTGGPVPLLPPPGGKVTTLDPSVSGSPARITPTPPAQQGSNADVTLGVAPVPSGPSKGSQPAEGSPNIWGGFSSVTNWETAKGSHPSGWVQF